MNDEEFPVCFEELITMDLEHQFFIDPATHVEKYRSAVCQQCEIQPVSPATGTTPKKLLVFAREWTRKFVRIDEICTLAKELEYEIYALRIRGVQPCEKVRHVVTADVVLLTHGSDYIMAGLARPGTVIIHFLPHRSRHMYFKTFYRYVCVCACAHV